ncbi:MAG TPA: DUF4340 domain-containing protein [Clostridia bacterium]|jgi:hypothetical protein|nr:DUF4340 domain-containing protein [Clostridia bacterium]
MKQYKVTFISLIVLAVVLAGYFLISGLIGGEPSNDDQDQVRRERVLAFNPNRVVKIETHYKEDFVLEKIDDKWVCTSHDDLKVHESSIISILNSYANMQGNVIVGEDETIIVENFGFHDDPPTFTIYLEDGKSHKLLLGNTTLSGSEIFCMFEGGDKVYKISGTFTERLQVTRATITTNKVFPNINKERINTVELVRHGETKYIIRGDFSGDEKAWKLTYPFTIKGDSTQINSLVDTLMALTVGDLVSTNVEDLSEYGLDVPVAKYTVKDNQTTRTLEIGDRTSDGYNRYCTVNGENHVYLIAMSKLSFVDNEVTMYMNTYPFLENQIVLSSVKLTIEGEVWNLDYEVTDTEENYWFNGVNVNRPNKDLRSQFKKITTAMYSLRLEEIDLEEPKPKELICSIEYTRTDNTKVLVEYYRRSENTCYIYVDGEFMNGMIYTRRITGDTSDSLINVVRNFESLMNEN